MSKCILQFYDYAHVCVLKSICYTVNASLNFFYILSQTYECTCVAALLVENGKFLLSAKRTRRTTCTEYVISMDADNISRSSSTYIGKLRYSNFVSDLLLLCDETLYRTLKKGKLKVRSSYKALLKQVKSRILLFQILVKLSGYVCLLAVPFLVFLGELLQR